MICKTFLLFPLCPRLLLDIFYLVHPNRYGDDFVDLDRAEDECKVQREDNTALEPFFRIILVQ
jgi:hypothetical protein